jgi:hypothetical protein
MFSPKPYFARFLVSKFKRGEELSNYGGRERKLTNDQYSMMKLVILDVNEFHLTRRILFRSFSLDLTEKDRYGIGDFFII